MPVLALPVSRSVVLAQSGSRLFSHIASGTVTESASATTRSPGKPTGTVDGNLVVVVCTWGSSATMTPAAGFNVGKENIVVNGGTGIYWKIASGEGASWTFTLSSASSFKAVAISFEGSPSVSVDDSDSANGSGVGKNYVLPSMTTTQANDLFVAACSNGGSRSYTEPTGMAELFDTGGGTANLSLGIYSEIFASVGATGTRTIAANNNVTGPAAIVAFKG